MGPSCLVRIGCVFLSKYLKYGIFILFDLLDKIGLKIVLTLPDYVWKDTTWFKNKKSFQGCHYVVVNSLWAEPGKKWLGKSQTFQCQYDSGVLPLYKDLQEECLLQLIWA